MRDRDGNRDPDWRDQADPETDREETNAERYQRYDDLMVFLPYILEGDQ